MGLTESKKSILPASVKAILSYAFSIQLAISFLGMKYIKYYSLYDFFLK